MMAYKVFTRLIGVLCHDFTTFGYLLFTKQYFAIYEAVLNSLVSIYSQIVGNKAPISMGFVSRGVWVMGYLGCLGYEAFFPANQLGGLKNLWD